MAAKATKAAPKRYWLLKCEPEAYSIDDLARDGETSWEGVRNFQARNSLRDDMKVGDAVLFYASNATPSGVAGLAEISREAYPDPFAFEEGHEYFDPKSRREQPTWMCVDVRFVAKFPELVPLDVLKETPGLEAMGVIRKGNRLSVQPVTAEEFEIVRALGLPKASKSRLELGVGATGGRPATKKATRSLRSRP
jgi:predicted RNA-binding protein with PUA-like domain